MDHKEMVCVWTGFMLFEVGWWLIILNVLMKLSDPK
jgi:hypothetical protein